MEKLLYAIKRESLDNELWLIVTPKSHWEKHHCQSDITPQKAFEILKQHDFPCGEVMEGVIEISNKDGSHPASEETEAGLAELLSNNEMFEMDIEFVDFCEECCTA